MMKKLSLFLICLLLPTPVFAQQTTTYQICTTYNETYIPGGYDRYGNYRQGYVDVQSYQNQCGGGGATYNNSYSSPYRRSNQICTSTGVGAVVGAGVAGAISEPDAMGWSIPLGILGGAILGSAFCED